MLAQDLHAWHVGIAEARRIQQRLQQQVAIGTYVHEIRYIAGADVSVSRFTPTVYAGIVVLDRIPEPTRLADQYVGAMRRTQEHG